MTFARAVLKAGQLLICYVYMLSNLSTFMKYWLVILNKVNKVTKSGSFIDLNCFTAVYNGGRQLR
jgi:hypothetical protein